MNGCSKQPARQGGGFDDEDLDTISGLSVRFLSNVSRATDCKNHSQSKTKCCRKENHRQAFISTIIVESFASHAIVRISFRFAL